MSGVVLVFRGGHAILHYTLAECIQFRHILGDFVFLQITRSVILNPVFHVLVFRLGWTSGATCDCAVLHYIVGRTYVGLVREYIAIRALVARKLTYSASLHALSWNIEQFVVLVCQLCRVDAVARVVCHLACYCWHGFAESGWVECEVSYITAWGGSTRYT